MSPAIAPAGQGPHVVRSGESLTAIAEAHGHIWERVWSDPANAELAALRKNPHVLLPGDRLTIPPVAPKTVACAVDQCHRFRRKSIPPTIHFVLRGPDGAPLADRRYELVWGDGAGASRSGRTDGQGALWVYIPTAVKRATLRLWPAVAFAPEVIERAIVVGALEPAGSLRGAQSRLNNLGFLCGRDDGRVDDMTRAAAAAFQRAAGLPETGELDEATRAELLKRYGM